MISFWAFVLVFVLVLAGLALLVEGFTWRR